MDWFELGEDAVKNLLYDDFQHIPIIQDCQTTTSVDPEAQLEELAATAYPNPFSNYVHIQFTTKNEWVKVSLFDNIGHEIRVLSSQQYPAGEHTITVKTHDLPAGSYYYRIQTEFLQKTKRLVKI